MRRAKGVEGRIEVCLEIGSVDSFDLVGMVIPKSQLAAARRVIYSAAKLIPRLVTLRHFAARLKGTGCAYARERCGTGLSDRVSGRPFLSASSFSPSRCFY